MRTPLRRPRSRALEAPVLEVFASIQGEGAHAGEPQTLLRLAGCPLRCRWCDTPGSWSLAGPSEGAHARIVDPAGARREDAWATPFRVATWIAAVEGPTPRTVSVTGGEPLLWPGFLRELRPYLGARRVHLETAGAYPGALAEVLDALDHVSLDLKLPEDLDDPEPLGVEPGPTPHGPDAWAAVRKATLELVRERDACAKVIVAGGREPAAFLPLLDDVARIAPALSVFLQPVTPVRGERAPEPRLLSALVEHALDRELDVRVVPQLHRVLGLP